MSGRRVRVQTSLLHDSPDFFLSVCHININIKNDFTLKIPSENVFSPRRMVSTTPAERTFVGDVAFEFCFHTSGPTTKRRFRMWSFAGGCAPLD